MSNLAERINTPISRAELERRWSAVRAAMADAGVDVLVAQNNGDYMGGYVKWFTDIPATQGYPMMVVFPLAGEMTVIAHGPFDGEPAPEDLGFRGVQQVVTTPNFASASYTRYYDADLALKALAPFAHGRVGVVGMFGFGAASYERLREGLGSAELFEASNLVDNIKVVKSPEEQALIRRTAALQDAAMRAAFEAAQPGMRDRDIAAVAQKTSHELGTEQGIYLCGSWPVGDPTGNFNNHFQERKVGKGDVITLLVENNGPGGFYAELGRTAVLGRAPAQLIEELEVSKAAQQFCLGLIRPGARSSDIFAAYNAYMRNEGLPEERRIHAHGQGYDLVEPPLIRRDESMRIQSGMNLVCHPSHTRHGVYSWICDNYLVHDDGTLEAIHKFPQEVTEL